MKLAGKSLILDSAFCKQLGFSRPCTLAGAHTQTAPPVCLIMTFIYTRTLKCWHKLHKCDLFILSIHDIWTYVQDFHVHKQCEAHSVSCNLIILKSMKLYLYLFTNSASLEMGCSNSNQYISTSTVSLTPSLSLIFILAPSLTSFLIVYSLPTLAAVCKGVCWEERENTLLMSLWRKHCMHQWLVHFLFPSLLSISTSSFYINSISCFSIFFVNPLYMHIPTDFHTCTLRKHQARANWFVTTVSTCTFYWHWYVQSLFGHLFCHTSDFFFTYSESSRSSIQAVVLKQREEWTLGSQQERCGHSQCYKKILKTCLSVTHKGF